MKTNLLALAALLSLTTSVAAQPAPAPPSPAPTPAAGDPNAGMTEDEKKAKAKALYEKGIGHYNLGEFDSAIMAFKDAYALSSAPGLLFNVAQSYRLKKDYEQATFFYQTYLRLKPDAPNRADVEDRLKEMEKEIAEQKEMMKKAPVGTVTPEGNAPTTAAPPPTTTSVTAEPVPEGPGNAKTLMTAGYVSGGAGAALVITGVIFGSMARSAESDLNALSTNMGTWDQDLYDSGKRNNTIAIVSFVAGGAAIVTGGVLWYMGYQKKQRATVAVVPGAQQTTVAVGWSF